MPLKKRIYLYDVVNDPLQVKGIRVELYDAVRKKLIDHDISHDLNPQPNNRLSDSWGVELSFPSGKTPLDILVIDPTYRYPGNALRYLNGELNDEVYMDLFQLPSGPGGGEPPSNATPPSVNDWINDSPNWDRQQKEAVRSLVFNYAAVLGSAANHAHYRELAGVAKNWEAAARQVGIPETILGPSSAITRALQQNVTRAARH